MDTRMCVLHNSAKTEMVAPQNDHATEWSVNFFDRHCSYSTAWVAQTSSPDRPIIITAAHTLKYGNEMATKLEFVPGYVPNEPHKFGKYPQIHGGEGVAWAVHPN